MAPARSEPPPDLECLLCKVSFATGTDDITGEKPPRWSSYKTTSVPGQFNLEKPNSYECYICMKARNRLDKTYFCSAVFKNPILYRQHESLRAEYVRMGSCWLTPEHERASVVASEGVRK